MEQFARDYPNGGFAIDDEPGTTLSLQVVLRFELQSCEPTLVPSLEELIPSASATRHKERPSRSPGRTADFRLLNASDTEIVKSMRRGAIDELEGCRGSHAADR